MAGNKRFTILTMDFQCAAFRLESIEQGVEMELATKTFNFQTDIFHHFRKIIRTHVWVLLIGNFLRSSVLVKLVEYKLVILAINTRVEFAVGECAGTAFAELHVGVGVQHFGLQESLHRLLTLFDTLAALNHDRMGTATGQIEGCEHARRSKTDHHGLVLVRPFRILKLGDYLALRHMGLANQMLVGIGNRDLHLEVEKHFVLFPRIHRLTHNATLLQILSADPELLTHRILEVLTLRYGNLYIG